MTTSSALHARIAVLVALLVTSACSTQPVTGYDDPTFEKILSVGREVDVFYGALLAEPAAERGYLRYRTRYIEIEASIRSLWVRNVARTDNADSSRIVADILAEWIRYRERHAQRDAYSDGNATLDRDRLLRLFIAAASAERAKKR